MTEEARRLTVQLVTDVSKNYETADRFARKVALFRQDTVIPANNELRYAGHHFIQAFGNPDSQPVQDNLRKAKNHCERAMYEAAEAGILRAVDEIFGFREAFKGVVISKVIPDYTDIRALAIKAQQMLARGRSDRDSPEQHAAEYMQMFKELVPAVEKLQAGEDDLIEQAKWDLLKRRLLILGSGLAVLTLLWRVLA